MTIVRKTTSLGFIQIPALAAGLMFLVGSLIVGAVTLQQVTNTNQSVDNRSQASDSYGNCFDGTRQVNRGDFACADFTSCVKCVDGRFTPASDSEKVSSCPWPCGSPTSPSNTNLTCPPSGEEVKYSPSGGKCYQLNGAVCGTGASQYCCNQEVGAEFCLPTNTPPPDNCNTPGGRCCSNSRDVWCNNDLITSSNNPDTCTCLAPTNPECSTGDRRWVGDNLQSCSSSLTWSGGITCQYGCNSSTNS